MTERLLVDRARDWVTNARSFHRKQLARHRKVMRLGKSRMVFTKGQAITTSGAVFAAGSVSSAGYPDWIFWSTLLGGILAGKFAFPIPDSSIASKRGPADVTPKNPVELDGMVPEQIRIYENNMVLKHRLKETTGLGTAQALGRQREAARVAEQSAAMAQGSLSKLSAVEAQAFRAAAEKHDRIKNRWLSYEINPQLQFDFPAMSDASFPETAAMIRAAQATEQAKSSARTAEYQSALAAFWSALNAAEEAAGVPKK